MERKSAAQMETQELSACAVSSTGPETEQQYLTASASLSAEAGRGVRWHLGQAQGHRGLQSVGAGQVHGGGGEVLVGGDGAVGLHGVYPVTTSGTAGDICFADQGGRSR